MRNENYSEAFQAKTRLIMIIKTKKKIIFIALSLTCLSLSDDLAESRMQQKSYKKSKTAVIAPF